MPQTRVAAAVSSIAYKSDAALDFLVDYQHHRFAGGQVFLSRTYKRFSAILFIIIFSFILLQCLGACFVMCLHSTYCPILILATVFLILDAITF